jgi:hypothetical protein
VGQDRQQRGVLLKIQKKIIEKKIIFRVYITPLLFSRSTQTHMLHTTPQTKGLILLIGAPGSGKSLLGQVLQTRGRNVAFFSVGNQLRKTGLLDEHDRADTVAKRKEIMERMRKEARAMVEKEIVCMESILVLECVKDIHDAFGLMELLREHQTVKLLQILYVSSRSVGKTLLRKAFVSHMAAI